MVCRFGKVWGNSKNGVTESRYGNSLVAREFKEVGRRGGSKELPEVQNRADSQSLDDDVLSCLGWQLSALQLCTGAARPLAVAVTLWRNTFFHASSCVV